MDSSAKGFDADADAAEDGAEVGADSDADADVDGVLLPSAITRSPCAANASPVARPIPRVPPVTTTIRVMALAFRRS